MPSDLLLIGKAKASFTNSAPFLLSQARKSIFLNSKLETLFTKLVSCFVFQIGSCICTAFVINVKFFFNEAEWRLLGKCFIVLVSAQGRFARCDCSFLQYVPMICSLHCVGLRLWGGEKTEMTRLKKAGKAQTTVLCWDFSDGGDTYICFIFSCKHSYVNKTAVSVY